ncbi:hypothetical protein Ga0074812_14924 [Parafrankia irregularis]|uniref:Uncharacterized protein n=1 Tax=Parafrankia irregularis TaxID=795642 RepID=A0A0S4QZ04_9ACTN|nr:MULTISPECIES: hypothetical protein [Frankiaceae]KPM50333.1 hypothetical protein ACG83_40920 [Frankia sp. R43]MBE3204715.1 hypothetical protein [Parafrankia sp. CH37]CUU60880.1 hypothetical protein Ga0074812_14924 [Parafrankia irregularis]
MHGSEATDRVLVVLREAAEHPDNEALDADLIPYFPGGCPDTAPDGWPHGTVDYGAPHAITVCPRCVESWRVDHRVSQPFPVPAGTPLILLFPWAAAQPVAATSDGGSRPANPGPAPVDTSA